MDDFLADPRRWKALLYRVVRATRNSVNAEDYLQEAFIRLSAYRRTHKVNNPAGLLVTMAVRIAIDDNRRQRRHGELDSVPVSDLLGLATDEPPTTDVLIARERLSYVRDGLKRLNPRTREVFLMHRIGGMKYREIAAHLGITVSAVEKHIAKAALFVADLTDDA